MAGRNNATAGPPDPEALGERERRQWTMLCAQLLGTGRHWLPRSEALALLWAVGQWREQLRHLLELLAVRADHRLHHLPRALPVPLQAPFGDPLAAARVLSRQQRTSLGAVISDLARQALVAPTPGSGSGPQGSDHRNGLCPCCPGRRREHQWISSW